jgi:hypothetical protein
MMNYSPAFIRNQNRRLVRRVATVNAVIAAMRRRGLSVHRHHQRNGVVEWTLSDGTPLKDVIARAVIANPSVIGVDDGLPLIGLPQTYRWAGD